MSEPSGVAARVHARDRGPSVSFELYPPRTEAGDAALWRSVERLTEVRPDFWSVTYGASGSNRETSRGVVRRLLADPAPPVAHLTCIGATRAELLGVAAALVSDGVRDFLALRGDPPADGSWVPRAGGVNRAFELVALLRGIEPLIGERISVGAAATPEAVRGAEAAELDPQRCGDLLALNAKQAAGADYAVSQVFFDARSYVRYLEVARAAGVTIPVLPGVVPLSDPARLRRLEAVSGVPVPPALLAVLDREADEAGRRAAGRTLGAELVAAVLEAGAPGVHVYTFNQHEAALDLLTAAGLR